MMKLQEMQLGKGEKGKEQEDQEIEMDIRVKQGDFEVEEARYELKGLDIYTQEECGAMNDIEAVTERLNHETRRKILSMTIASRPSCPFWFWYLVLYFTPYEDAAIPMLAICCTRVIEVTTHRLCC
jgi:hypothetical protein